MRTLILGTLCSLLGVLAIGCGSDPGSISVQWDIGLSGSCDDAGVTTVRITLTSSDGTMGPFEAPCSAGADGFQIDDVDTGSYSISLEGLDADGNVIYTGRSSSNSNVSEGKTASPAAIVMSPAPAQLTIQWKFDNGLGCAVQEGAPDEVQVVLFKSDANEAEETASCDDSQVVFPDLEADDNYDVRATAMGGGDPLYRFEELDIELADGQQETRLGTFVPCADIAGGCN